MKKKPTILVVENAVDPTGSLYSILRSSESLKEHFSFEFLLPADGGAAAILREFGFKTRVIPMRELRRDVFSVLFYLPRLFGNVLKFRRLLRSISADLVVNNDFYNLLPAFGVLLGSPVPYVCYVRFMPSRFPKELTNFWFGLHEKLSSKVVAVSQAVKQELPKSDKIAVVYNELPIHSVESTLPSGTLILFPANYIAGKGQEHAVVAFARVAKTYPQWTLRFIGGDMGLQKNKAFKRSLVTHVEELGLTDNIEFLEFSPSLAQHYLECAFVLNFSESESFSLTTLEAQYYGRPVIVTRCGGPEEIVIDRVTGILVPKNDVDSMVQAIEYLISHPTERNHMATKAYTHVREKFSHQHTTEILSEIYRSAIKS